MSRAKRSHPVARLLIGALRTRRGQLGAVLSLAVLAVAFFGPLIPARSATGFAAPPFTAPGGVGGLLGSDTLGRDVLARVLHGGWRIVLFGIAATLVGVGSGTIAGVTAAYRRGLTDAVTMRSIDVALAIPSLVFVLLMLSVTGPKWWLVVLAAGVAQAPQTARVVHAAAQDVCERDFVKAVAAWGMPARQVIRRHVLPSLTTPLMVEFGMRFSYSIVLIAGLSFLGLGTQPPNPDWGVMINENRVGLGVNPWAVVAPALLLAGLAVGINVFTDAVARARVGRTAGEDLVLAANLAEVTER